MRRLVIGPAVILLAACGASASVHYDVQGALDCIRRSDSLTFPNAPRGGIYAAYTSDDGVSALERVAVAFAPVKAESVANSFASTRLGVDKPSWSERRGDAEVLGFGPYEPPVAKRQGVTDAQARAAANELGPRVRTAIDTCLKRNER